MAQQVDSSILHEIVRIVEARRKVPGRVQVRLREYLITYLDDHQRRLEEALQRHDTDRLNMLYGQLASKVKYQLFRSVRSRASARGAKKSQGQAQGRAARPVSPARGPARPKKAAKEETQVKRGTTARSRTAARKRK